MKCQWCATIEQGENNPASALFKQMLATVYQAHPYHHDTIGWRTDIENVSIERLQKFYKDFYCQTMPLVSGW